MLIFSLSLQNVSEQAMLLDFAIGFLRRASSDAKPPVWATQGWATRPITPEFIQELDNRVLLLSITNESGYLSLLHIFSAHDANSIPFSCHSDGSKEIGDDGIDENVLEEIVGKLINQSKLEKAESICTKLPQSEELFFRIHPCFFRQTIQLGRQRFDDSEGDERDR